MSTIPFVLCPDCDKKLVAKAGFTAGQKVKCPKCESVFAVPAPTRKPVVLEEDEEDMPRPVKKQTRAVVEDDEDADERPRKKKKKGEKSGGYANSPLRFVILGVLVVTMLVLGYFLYRKFTAPPPPDIIVPAKNAPGDD